MTPYEIFKIPGKFVLYELILPFFQIPVWELAPELGDVFALLLSLMFWSILLGQIVIPIINRQFSIAPRGRY